VAACGPRTAVREATDHRIHGRGNAFGLESMDRHPARDSVWTLWVGAKKWEFKSNKEIELKEKIACCEFSA
jgi:hypothetical protein